jgi:ornithine cyclodeaminase
VIDRAHVRAELAELVADPARGRTAPSDITLFKSVGTALEDLAAARCVLEG